LENLLLLITGILAGLTSIPLTYFAVHRHRRAPAPAPVASLPARAARRGARGRRCAV